MGALLAFAPTSSAQLIDAISAINGETFVDDAQARYFNREQCGLGGTGGDGGTGGTGGSAGAGGTGGSAGAGGTAGAGGSAGTGGTASAAQKAGPEDTTFQIRIDQTGPVSDVFLWVGKAGAQCEQLAQRNETQGLCAEVPGEPGNPRPVGSNFLITGLFLQDLIDARAGGAEIVTCNSSGLRGTEYQIFVFREAPTGDVAAANYGVAKFFVDVEAPNPPQVNTNPQRQGVFTISWGEPDPPDDIQTWEFYSSDVDDAATAEPLGITASLDKRSQSISAAQLGLEEGESAYVFMNAFDMAFVSDPRGGNGSELSEGVMVTFVPVEGYCDASGQCGGCSVSPMTLMGGDPSSIAWILGLVFGAVFVWRLRR